VTAMAPLTASVHGPGAATDPDQAVRPLAGPPDQPEGTGPPQSPPGPDVRSWPLLVLATPGRGRGVVRVVGIALKARFGLVSPVSGIWPSLP
jgi:hypothetical protein